MPLQRIREWLSLVLIALLPFHAFIVTVKTRFLLGPGQAPMGEIAVWKEVVLAIILLIAMVEIASQLLSFSASQRKFDLLDALIIGLLLLGVIVSIFNYQLSIINFVYGVRYDFIPLLSFLLLRRVPWSDVFLKRVMKVLLIVGVIVAAYGILSFFLPQSFFTWLGYNDLHSLYLPGGPIAPFQQIGGTALRRIQSVLSGPNQLGLWLLIPLAIVFSKFSILNSQFSIFLKQYGLHAAFLIGALILSFSRAAWIGAAIIIGIALWPVVRRMSRTALVTFGSCAVCCLVLLFVLFPSVILRVASSRGHIENPLRAMQTMIEHPFGLGLGTAGPASNRTSDACVMLEEGSDASWAADRPELCVFVGQLQVQPLDRACNCPFLPENWYLQIGVEMGWLGFCLYIGLVVAVLIKLRELKIENEKLKMKVQSSKFSIINYQLSIFAALSIASLFLHAWEDSALAYTVWLLIATQLPIAMRVVREKKVTSE